MPDEEESGGESTQAGCGSLFMNQILPNRVSKAPVYEGEISPFLHRLQSHEVALIFPGQLRGIPLAANCRVGIKEVDSFTANGGEIVVARDDQMVPTFDQIQAFVGPRAIANLVTQRPNLIRSPELTSGVRNDGLKRDDIAVNIRDESYQQCRTVEASQARMWGIR